MRLGSVSSTASSEVALTRSNERGPLRAPRRVRRPIDMTPARPAETRRGRPAEARGRSVDRADAPFRLPT